MRRLIESIKIQNGIPQNLEYHQRRMDTAREKLFGFTDIVRLVTEIKVPSEYKDGVVKCRVVYSDKIHSIEFENYKIRQIKTLKIVHSQNIDYVYKWQDRTELNELFNQRENCDDLIIVKNNLITDASFANLVFYDGLEYFTPETPLLNGVARQKLIEQNKIKIKKIYFKDLHLFKCVFLINAMLEINDIRVDIADII